MTRFFSLVLVAVVLAPACSDDVDLDTSFVPSTTAATTTTTAPVGNLVMTPLGAMHWREMSLAAGGQGPGGGLAGIGIDDGLVLLVRSRQSQLVTCLAGSDCRTETPDLGGGSALCLASGSETLWLGGSADGAPAVWSSPDGSAWQLHQLPVAPDFAGPAFATEIVVSSDRTLVLAPSSGDRPMGPDNPPLVWVGDESGFESVDNPHESMLDAASASGVFGEPTTVVGDEAGFVAGLGAGPFPYTPSATSWFRSGDGIVWNEVQPSSGDTRVRGLARLGTRYLALTESGGSESVRWSEDLAGWTELGIPGLIYGVECGRSGCAVLALEGGSYGLWLSVDGLVWDGPVPLVEFEEMGDVNGRQLVVGEGLVAVWMQPGIAETIPDTRIWIGEVVGS
ncbi:MAG: hypothetical protein HKP18_11825 [Acidimicrobiia bacterium]|nr:hypothetical protein [Acidimicrobiia bacterium]